MLVSERTEENGGFMAQELFKSVKFVDYLDNLAEAMKRKVCIVTGTRAEWGLLSGIARELDRNGGVELQIVATNMHLDPDYGMTVNEIIADGFTVNECVPMPAASDTPADKVRAMSLCLAGMADAFSRLTPDMVVILGDRYEMLAVASAATVMCIPIAHIAGGEITEGAIDDSIRHAITKMSALHLTATEEYRRRVIAMGEHPDRVINAGAIGVYNIMNEPLMSHEELEKSVGTGVTRDTLLVTMHPATLDSCDTGERMQALLDALSQFPDSNIIFTYPNNDARGEVIIRMIDEYAASQPQRVRVIPSLGKLRYLSALRYVGAVVGNSSSGIVEVPSMKIPTVDIGMRQRGRLASDSVIHCGDSAGEITAAIALALSDEGRRRAMISPNPYFQPDTLCKIVGPIVDTPLEYLRHKTFYDVNPLK